MRCQSVVLISFLIFRGFYASPLHSHNNVTTCKCSPDDPCWPNQNVWSSLNDTLNGRLIWTIPLGTPCHDPSYDAGGCLLLKNEWNYAPVHAADPSSIMMPVFQNGTCDPFHPAQKPCTLGNLVRYSVNATEPSHIQTAVNFAAAHNIRLVIKNTGHDFLGRSTASNALGVWTHHLDSVEFLSSYSGPTYSGPAIKIGAGTQAAQADETAHSLGYRIMGGTCPTVGLAGGYTQGGGHGVLTSLNGLASDSVLEWEVVTADGKLVTASPAENANLYWALSGGGGGTFGVVTSMTTKAYPEAPTTGASLAFNLTTSDEFWNAIAVLQMGVTPLVDTASVLLIEISNSTVNALIAAPLVDESTLREQLDYITSHLNQSAILYSLEIETYPSYFDYFLANFGPLPNGIWPVSHLIGSRLLPRSLFQSQSLTSKLQAVAQSITTNNEWAISAVTINANRTVANTTTPSNAVLPAWRDALVHYTVYSVWDWTSDAEMNSRSDRLTDEIIPALEELSPGSGTYANEANYRQENWQTEFFGSNWNKLNIIKRQWDPRGIFYAPLSAGADQWMENDQGRLCRVTR